MLNLSKRKATKMIKRLGNGLFEHDGVACDYFYEPCEYDASTHITDDGHADEVNIGLVNIQKTPFARPVSDENFVRVVLNMYHEKMHCIQKNVLFKEENLDEHTEKQLIQEIACRDKKSTGGDTRATALVSMTVDEKERLTTKAKAHGLSLSAFFRLAADEYMNNHNW